MKTTKWIVYLINFIIGLVLVLIGFRVILKLFGASESAAFVDWIYSMTMPLLHPFQGMFPSPSVDGGFILEFSALFALIVYALFGYLLTQLVLFIERNFDNKP